MEDAEERQKVREKHSDKLNIREVVITLLQDKETKMEGLFIECAGVPPLELIGVLDLALEQAKNNMIAGKALPKDQNMIAEIEKKILQFGIPRPSNGHDINMHG